MDTTTTPPGTLYDRLGGRDAVGAAVDALYTRLLADPALAPYFVGIAMPRLRGHMRMFLTAALGDGASEHLVANLAPAHAHLGITDADFDCVAGHLVGALTGLGVDAASVAQVVDVVGPLRAVIVTAPSA